MELAAIQMRLRLRVAALATSALLTAAFIAIGGLDARWAVAGVLAVAAWAALWPMASEGAYGRGPLSGLRSNQPPHVTAEAGQTWSIVLSGLSDAAVMLDGEGIVVATNALAQDILSAAPGRHVSAYSRVPDLLSAVDSARQSGAPATFHLRLTIPVERHLLGRVTPLLQTGGSRGETPLLVVLRDLTEQEKLMRLRADFVANASHELKTPLTALKGFLETLRGSARDDPAARERFIGIMLEQANRMSRLIDDLLSLSQIEMRQHVVPRGVVDLGDIAREVARLVEPLAEAAGITVRLEAGQEATRVVGDHDELLQVTQNLVQNAVKYGRKGGWVDVSVRPDGARVALVVADNGIGIGAEHLPRLTERFYRVNVRESHMRGGTGLGLAIVKHIVNRHLGELLVESKLGQGSTFTVLLPAAPSKTKIQSNQ